MILFLKDKCFYFFYFLSVFWFGLTGSLFFWLPYRFRFSYISLWNRIIVALARIFIGVKVNVIGRENIPSTPCVIMSKHQSEWETFYLQTIFPHLCTILKKELLGIPFFGWALKQMEPIAIDRSSPKDALRKVQEIGLKRLKQNRSVLIFPEGTRVKPGERGRYARSGANLAIASKTMILPIAHNAGIYWQNKQRKQAGTITFIIGAPISTNEKPAKQLMNEVENWIEEQSTSLLTTANPS